MIRLLVAILVLQLSIFSLVACTTSPSSSDDASEDAALSDGGIDDAALAGNTDQANAAVEKPGAEDDLEKDLEGADSTLAKKEAPSTDADVTLDDTVNETPPPLPPEAPPVAEAPPVEPAPVVPSPIPPSAPAEQKNRINDIRYLANSNGGTIVIESTRPVTYQTRMNAASQQFVIEVADVELPANLQRPYALKDFASRFGSINAYQSAGSSTARIVIQLASASTGEPIVQQEGTSIVVVPPAVSAPVAAAPSAPKVETPKENPLGAQTLDQFLAGTQRFYGRPISLQVKDADVRDVVNFLAEESGANVVMSDDVTGKISLKLRRIPWDQALVTVMRAKSLGYVRQGNVLRISTLKTMQAESELSGKLLESQKAVQPMVVKVFPISYAALDDLIKTVTPFISKEGKVVTDNRSSTLILTDKQEIIERVAKLIKTLDIAPAQVSIESKIVEAVEGFESFAGVTWGAGGSATQLSATGGYGGGPINLTPGIQSGSLSSTFTGGTPFSANINVGVLDVFGSLTATLSLAEKDSLAKVITSPRISTLNREKSTITQVGENVTVVTSRADVPGATSTITKTEKRTPYTLELSVTPQITSDGGVIMDLDVKREFLGAVVDPQLQSRPVNTRKAKTKVLVRNGQTAVIGGIYTNDETENVQGIPGLMNIPVLGWLFKNKSVTRAKNELLIFMTPRILESISHPQEQAANAL